MTEDYDAVLDRLEQSEFRRKFKLNAEDKEYVRKKGMATIAAHAKDFVEKRLSDVSKVTDGKQTPMRGHPVFVAQRRNSESFSSVTSIRTVLS